MNRHRTILGYVDCRLETHGLWNGALALGLGLKAADAVICPCPEYRADPVPVLISCIMFYSQGAGEIYRDQL